MLIVLICIYVYTCIYRRNDLADTLANQGKSGRACKQGRYAIDNKLTINKHDHISHHVTSSTSAVVANSNSNVIIDLSLDDPSPPPSRPSSPLKQGVTATTDLTRTSSPLPPPISPPASSDTDDDQSTDEIEFSKYKANLTKKIAKIDSPPSLYKYLKYTITSLSRRIAQGALVSTDLPLTPPLPPTGERRGIAGGASDEGESKGVIELPSPKSRRRKRGSMVVDSETMTSSLAPSSSSSSPPLNTDKAPAFTQGYGTGRLISSLPSTSSDLPYVADYTAPYHPIDPSLVPTFSASPTTKKRRRTKRSLSQDVTITDNDSGSESESEGISMASVSSDSRLLAVVGETMPVPITDIIVSEGPEKMDGGDLSNNHKLGIMRHERITE